MDALFSDLRYAFIGLIRAPKIIGLAVLSLALGVAVNTTMFTALDAFLLRPLPYQNSERIVRLWLQDLSQDGERLDLTAADYENFRERSRTVDLAAYAGVSMNVVSAEEPVRLGGVQVSDNLLRVLGASPLSGRGFTAADFLAGGEHVVMISESLWEGRFAGDTRALGSILRLDNQAHTIVGVLPDEFRFPNATTDIYTPLRVAAAEPGDRSLSVIGRLLPGSTIDGAGAELAAIGRSLAGEYPETNDRMGTLLMRLDRAMFNSRFRTGAAVCLVAVMFVLLIACSNVANLLLARAATRRREVAVCIALGATKRRIVQRTTIENLLIAFAGGAIGALLSVWGVEGLTAIIPADIPMAERIRLDGRGLLFTLAISIGSALVFGLAPTLQTSAHDLSSSMRAGARGTLGGGRAARLRSVLVITQIALALILLIGAGLLIKGYTRATSTELGFRTENVLTMRVALPASAYRETTQILAFIAQLDEKLRAIPGVEAVAVADALPTTPFGSGVRYTVADGTSATPDGRRAELRSITPAFLDALEIRRREGRGFVTRDDAEGAPVVIVNQSFASRNEQPDNLLGRQITFQGTNWEIVGVVDDVKEWGAAEMTPRMIYVPLAQRPVRTFSIAVRSELPAETLVPQLRDAVRAEDPNLPLFEVASFDDLIRRSQERDGLMVRLLSIFSAIATILALLGVYGVMAYNVSQRSAEVGLRIAVGAQPRDLVGLMVRKGACLAGAGVLIGLIGAIGVSRFLTGFLNGVSPSDVRTFTGMASAVFFVAVFATYIPARNAALADPSEALRRH